eukprot:Sro1361_g266220.2  (318) ;mRNA; f:18782-19735
MDKTFPSNLTIAHQVQHSFHMHLTKTKRDYLRSSTSILVTLQNPVDRVITAWSGSHPAHCDPKNQRTWSCRLKAAAKVKGFEEHDLFEVCFPKASMEDFAQSTMSPYQPISGLTPEQQSACRDLAFGTATGYSETSSTSGKYKAMPAMYFNYWYYLERTLRAYPKTEFFGIRQEREWKDLRRLNMFLGFKGDDANMAGMPEPKPTPLDPEISALSTMAYRKLCCVLSEEIWHYREMLRATINLSNVQPTMENVRHKCGIITSWGSWRAECRHHLENDNLERQSRAEELSPKPGKVHTTTGRVTKPRTVEKATNNKLA